MSPEDRDRRRRWLVRSVVAVVVTVALVAGVPWLYARFAPSRPAPLALTTSVTTGEVPEAVPESVAPAEIDGTWVVGDGSEAGYRLDEVLSGEALTVVGRTPDVSGTLDVVDGVLVAAEVAVEVATITTDESARDAYMRLALDATAHPAATFALTAPVDVSALAATADPVTVPVTGDLEIGGVSRPVAAELRVQRTVDGAEVAGQVPVLLGDHGLSAPDVGFVTVDEEGVVEMRLVLTRQR